MKKTLLAIASTGAISLATMGTAQAFDDADDAIEFRQSVFHLVAAHTGQIGDMFKGKKEYDVAEVQYRSESLAALAQMGLEGFQYPGSDEGDTKAKPAVWEDMKGFEMKMSQFQQDTAALAEAARGGDQDDIKKAFMAAAKNCKACHSDYKNR